MFDKAKKRVKVIKKSIRKAATLSFPLARGRIKSFGGVSISVSQVSMSRNSAIAFRPRPLSLYLPALVCSTNASKVLR